jgi:bisphosphoglycerate-independent phosphoglycerate mutase (AlkP superfamily)
VIAGPAVAGRALDDGVLADVAPTLLELAGMAPWPGITGRSLLR